MQSLNQVNAGKVFMNFIQTFKNWFQYRKRFFPEWARALWKFSLIISSEHRSLKKKHWAEMRLPETEGCKPQSVSTVKLKHFRSEKFRCAFSVKKKGGVAAPWKISLQKAQNSFPNHLFRHQISKYRMIMILLTGWCTKTPFSPFDPVQLRKLYQVDSSLTISQYRILTPICNTILLIVSYWSTNIKLT